MRLLTCLSPYFFCYSKNWAICIWLNFMRTHINLKICHFLLSVVSITEGPKNKIMRRSGIKICHFLQSAASITQGPKNKILRKSGIHSSVPCWDSTLEHFLFYRVSGKMQKATSFEATAIAKYIYQNNTSAIKERRQETSYFSFFLDTQQNKKCSIVLSRHGTELWMSDFLIISFFGPSIMLTTDSKK